MKYATFDTYSERREDERLAYSTYLSTVRDRLPADLQLITGAGGDLSLNDGTIRSLQVDIVNRVVTIDMFVDRWVHGWMHQGALRLEYSDVCDFGIESGRNVHFPGRPGYGDHVYEEVELIAADQFEHRILFSSLSEVHVRFGNLVILESEDITGPWRPIDTSVLT
jgi:hypothetical protein